MNWPNKARYHDWSKYVTHKADCPVLCKDNYPQSQTCSFGHPLPHVCTCDGAQWLAAREKNRREHRDARERAEEDVRRSNERVTVLLGNRQDLEAALEKAEAKTDSFIAEWKAALKERDEANSKLQHAEAALKTADTIARALYHRAEHAEAAVEKAEAKTDNFISEWKAALRERDDANQQLEQRTVRLGVLEEETAAAERARVVEIVNKTKAAHRWTASLCLVDTACDEILRRIGEEKK